MRTLVDTVRLVGRVNTAERVIEECRRRGITISANEAEALLSGEDVQLWQPFATVEVTGHLVTSELDCFLEYEET